MKRDHDHIYVPHEQVEILLEVAQQTVPGIQRHPDFDAVTLYGKTLRVLADAAEQIADETQTMSFEARLAAQDPRCSLKDWQAGTHLSIILEGVAAICRQDAAEFRSLDGSLWPEPETGLND